MNRAAERYQVRDAVILLFCCCEIQRGDSHAQTIPEELNTSSPGRSIVTTVVLFKDDGALARDVSPSHYYHDDGPDVCHVF